MNEFLVGVAIALVPGLPVAAWLTWPRRYSAVVALGVAEAVTVLTLAVLDQHPPRPAHTHAPVTVRPPAAPSSRTCAVGGTGARDVCAAPGAPAASTPVVPALQRPPRQARRAVVGPYSSPTGGPTTRRDVVA